MDLSDYNLPFTAENIEELSGGSRSRGYRVNGYIVRIPVRYDIHMEQKREAEISALMQQNLPEHLKNRVTNVCFNGKCAYHKEIQGELLDHVYTKMNFKERHQLAKDIAELLVAIHHVPTSQVQTITQKYVKTCRNENKTQQADFDYNITILQNLRF